MNKNINYVAAKMVKKKKCLISLLFYSNMIKCVIVGNLPACDTHQFLLFSKHKRLTVSEHDCKTKVAQWSIIDFKKTIYFHVLLKCKKTFKVFKIFRFFFTFSVLCNYIVLHTILKWEITYYSTCISGLSNDSSELTACLKPQHLTSVCYI